MAIIVIQCSVGAMAYGEGVWKVCSADAYHKFA